MAVQLPPIGGASFQERYDASRNNAQARKMNDQAISQNAMIGEQTQRALERDAMMMAGTGVYEMAKQGAAWSKQDPNAWAKMMPDFQRRFQEWELPAEMLPGTDAIPTDEDWQELMQFGRFLQAQAGPEQESGLEGSTSQIRNEEYRRRMIEEGRWTQEDQDRFDASVRAPKYGDIAGVPSRLGPSTTEPLSTLDAEAEARGTLKRAEAEAQAGVISAGERVGATTKYPRMTAARRDLGGLREAHNRILQNKRFQGGPMQGGALALTPDGQAFQRYTDSLMSHISALTRIPGVGAQSDWEGRLMQAPLPSLNMYPEVREQAFESMEQLVNDLEAAVAAVTSGDTGNLGPQGNDGVDDDAMIEDNVLEQARQAIANGKDEAAVRQRLQELGVDPTRL